MVVFSVGVAGREDDHRASTTREQLDEVSRLRQVLQSVVLQLYTSVESGVPGRRHTKRPFRTNRDV